MIVILATNKILSAEQCVLLQRYFILVLLVHYSVLSSKMCSNQDVFKSSSRDFIAMTCIGKKKSDPKRRGVLNKYMEVY